LSLPRVLGNHPDTTQPITASIGRFGPYIVHEKDFRSLKTDNVYDITLDRALEILKEPKKPRRFRKKEEKK
jgi:DNA topoisomerase-1